MVNFGILIVIVLKFVVFYLEGGFKESDIGELKV